MLAGLMSEAFVLGWISEIGEVNYFKKNLCVMKRNDNYGKVNFADYIDYSLKNIHLNGINNLIGRERFGNNAIWFTQNYV